MSQCQLVTTLFTVLLFVTAHMLIFGRYFVDNGTDFFYPTVFMLFVSLFMIGYMIAEYLKIQPILSITAVYFLYVLYFILWASYTDDNMSSNDDGPVGPIGNGSNNMPKQPNFDLARHLKSKGKKNKSLLTAVKSLLPRHREGFDYPESVPYSVREGH
jgi:hypothetical protein